MARKRSGNVESSMEVETPDMGTDHLVNKTGEEDAQAVETENDSVAPTLTQEAAQQFMADVQSAEESSQLAKTLPRPNIRYVGSGEPSTAIHDGMTAIILPDAETQKAGPFFHSEAGRICGLFPKLYKRFQKLSEV